MVRLASILLILSTSVAAADYRLMSFDRLQHSLHLDRDVAIAITALGNMADAGPREVIGEDRNLLVCHHIEYAQSRRDPLRRVGVAGELSARILHLQHGLVTEVGDINERATPRADHKAAVADRMPRRRQRLHTRHNILTVFEEDNVVAQGSSASRIGPM